MWNFAKKFIPGAIIEPVEKEKEEAKPPPPPAIPEPKSPTDSLDGSFVFVDENSKAANEDDIPDEQQIFIKTFRPKKRPVSDIIKGTDWESVNYSLKKIECQEDEITGIEVSESFIVIQYYIEPVIDVYNRNSEGNELLLSLTGHEYGGGALAIVNDRYLYSGSMDKCTICWDLKDGGKILGQTQDHFDYISTIFANESFVATGGKGDKLIHVYEPLTLALKYKLEGHTGWISGLFVNSESILISSSADRTIKTWNLNDGSLLRTYEEDAGITAIIPSDNLILFGDSDSKLSFLDRKTGETLHLLPNTLVSTGRYVRSSKYHDKGIDNLHLSDNGYLITVSSGSKYVKIWKFQRSFTGDWEKTDIKELQILRDHTDYLTALRVYGNRIYSSCSDGHVYIHEFPIGQAHYDMAEEQEEDQSNVVSLCSNGAVSEAPRNPTELCLGGYRCRTGKNGISKSSSSFMVSFQLRPAVAEVKENIRLSAVIIPEEDESDEEEDQTSSSDSDEYEVVFETESDTEDDE